MAETSQSTPAGGAGEKKLSAADAAKRVQRTVVERVKSGKDGAGNDLVKETSKKVAVAASDVLDFKDYGTHVVVVTKDGQKLSSKDEG